MPQKSRKCFPFRNSWVRFLFNWDSRCPIFCLCSVLQTIVCPNGPFHLVILYCLSNIFVPQCHIRYWKRVVLYQCINHYQKEKQKTKTQTHMPNKIQFKWPRSIGNKTLLSKQRSQSRLPNDDNLYHIWRETIKYHLK